MQHHLAYEWVTRIGSRDKHLCFKPSFKNIFIKVYFRHGLANRDVPQFWGIFSLVTAMKSAWKQENRYWHSVRPYLDDNERYFLNWIF